VLLSVYSRAASFSAAARSPSVVACAYTSSTSRGVECPSRCCAVRRSIPAPTRDVAAKSRSRCGLNPSRPRRLIAGAQNLDRHDL
jgi:hypothetical protein